MLRLTAALLLLVLLGCAGGPEPVRQPTALPIPPTVETSVTKTVHHGTILDFHGDSGAATVAEMIARSKVVVRATFASVEPVGTRSDDQWLGSLEITFDVAEYLKGTGPTQVKALAYGWPIGGDLLMDQTEPGAIEKARAVLLDARWDDREAVVFLRTLPSAPSSTVYLLGEISPYDRDKRGFTVVDGEFKAWLPDEATTPATPPTSGGRTAKGEQRFLLDDPGAGGARGASAATSASMLAILVFKADNPMVEAEVAAGGGSQAYRDCVAEAHITNRWARGAEQQRHSGTIGSGLPAGTRMATDDEALVVKSFVPDYEYGKTWYEGRDAALMAFEPPAYTVSVRPLPAGEYRAFFEALPQRLMACQLVLPNVRGTDEVVVTVTAPAGTLAEAFFDPVANGTAVSATTTIGAVGWEDGTVTANLSIEAGGQLDFIDLTGTTTLSLSVAEAATSTPNTLTWAVATQPWSDGDRLMLRVRAAPPSLVVSLSPRVGQYLTYTNLTAEWTDPAACDSRYFVGLYEGETVRRNLSSHPAPETTGLSVELGFTFDRISNYDWNARVTCAPSDGSGWTVVAETPMLSGLPDSP